ncbi:MAG: hypothetical protein A2V70_16585, partial [Planctomycetes bacterium RBG_13_63_9]
FDWPQWQGPDRNAVSKQRGLLKEWTEDGPPLAWRIEGLGGGYSAPSIAAGRIYGMSSRGDDEVVWALSEVDGKELWGTRLGPALREGMPQGREGPGCTPTVDGDRLYVLGLGGDLACLQAQDGKIIWRHSLTDDLGGRLPTWRYNESPLVDGDKLICTPGGEEATLVALDKLTGDVIWKSKVPEGGDGADGGPGRGRGGGADPGAARQPSESAGQRNSASGDLDREERQQPRETPAPPRVQPVIVIPAGSRWKFLDTGASPGPDWTKLDFKDDAWREGPAQLGYGDGDEKTRLNDARDNYPTYYFRLMFEVKDPSKLKPLVLRLIRDDGAVVFINGREVLRDNMPTGSLDHDTHAADVAVVENEFYVHDVAPNQLVAGNNIIAVEVHQANANSSDVSFDLELREKVPGRDVVGAPRAERQPGFERGRGGFGRGGFSRSAAAYASAIAIDFDGQRQYVQLLATTLVGVAASDGKFLWRYDRPANRMGINCSTPLYHDRLVFAASAYGAGGGAVKLSKDASGAVRAEEVYSTTRMQNHHGGMIVVDGCLYGANGGNEGGFLACLDFQTGDVLWRDRKAPKGSLALADGRLYCRTEDGTMLLIEPNREQYVERGRFEQPDRTRSPAWTHPVIANGRLYVRDQDLLLCYDIRQD